MSMLPCGIIPIVKEGQRQIFDFVFETGQTLITDFHCLDRKVLAEGDVLMTLGGEQERKKITSIAALREAMSQFVSAAVEILQRHTPYDLSYPSSYPNFSNLSKDLLVEQLVFDILFDKYLSESEWMTRSGYSTHMSEFLEKDKYSYNVAINERLRRGMGSFHDMVKNSQLREQFEQLGVNPDKFAQFYYPNMKENFGKKKPKYVWDLLYYNFVLEISSRQYRRQLTRDSRNYPYEEIINDLKLYGMFVNMLLPVEQESPRKYFNMSMDYYALEVYKRNDFMFKLIDTLQKTGISKITHEHFLVRRFVPIVLVPYTRDNELCFDRNYQYYRPLFRIEEEIHRKMQKDINLDQRFYDSLLLKYQYVRAKTYELFKYHAEYISNDYSDIKRFLCQSYNMRIYHNSTGIWEIVADKEWKEMGSEIQQKVKEQIRCFLAINEAFFWKASNRTVNHEE